MNNAYKVKKRFFIGIHWSARIIGIIVSFFWVMSLIAGFIQEFGTPVSTEGFMLFSLIIANTAGVIVAWRKEKIGGIITVIAATSLCIFSYITAGHNKMIAVLFSGFPFLISGILFIISGWMSRQVSIDRKL